MKKYILGIALIAITAIGAKAFAFSRLSKEEKVTKITEKMAKKLSLTKERQEKVYTINLKRYEGHQNAYQQGRNKEILKTAINNWKAELQSVLTLEQAKKLHLK